MRSSAFTARSARLIHPGISAHHNAMEVTVAGGAVIDIASKDDIQRHHDRVEKLIGERRPTGKYYRVIASGVTTSGFSGSGPIAIAFTPSSPPAGRHWFVQWVAIWPGTSPATGAVANLFAAVAVGRSPVPPGASIPGAFLGALSEADIVVPGLAVPLSVPIPDKTVVKPQDQLYVLLAGSGLAASTTYVATAGVIDTPDSDETYFW